MRLKRKHSLARFLASEAAAAGLSVQDYLRHRTAQAIAIERHLGPEAWAKLIITLENERLAKLYFKDQASKLTRHEKRLARMKARRLS